MDEHQAVWDSRYKRVLEEARALSGEAWLEEWLHLVPTGAPPRALDIGCGSGHNTRLLEERGFEVSALDFSEHALVLCRRGAPRARVLLADIREGLPFAGEHFDLIVADLTLHYFPWDLTVALAGDIVNRLAPGGLFAGRFNSTGDSNYGAGTGEPVPGESNLFRVGGIEKRFFTRECVKRLFGSPWKTVALAEKRTCRFGAEKVLWELVATR